MKGRERSECFINYMYYLRNNEGATKTQICEGLCSINTYSAYENGEKSINKNLQDRMLGRLGIGSNNFVYITGVTEYDNWYFRMEIIEKVICRQLAKALELLELFFEKKNCKDSLNRQFYYHIKAMISVMQNAPRTEVLQYLAEAKNATMSKVTVETLNCYLLAPQEVDILLDYCYYGEMCDRESFHRIIEYIEKRSYDSCARAEVLPKAVLYYVSVLKRESRLKEWPTYLHKEVYQYSSEAVESLRNVKSTLYLWEMVKLRKELMDILNIAEDEIIDWIESLEYVYDRFRYERETKETAILYLSKNVYCINDVVRKRRMMLGLTVEELSARANIEPRELRYIENKERSPRRDTGKKLLRALCLPDDYSKSSLTIDTPKEKNLLDDLIRAMNCHQFEEAESCYEYLNESFRNRNDVFNRQKLLKTKYSIDYFKERITLIQYLQLLKETIELTVPFDCILNNEEKYLSYNEMQLLYSYVSNLPDEWAEKEKGLQIFEKYIEELIDGPIALSQSALIGTILDMVENSRGNKHEFDAANCYCLTVVGLELNARNLRCIANMIHDLEWNKAENEKVVDTTSKMRIKPLRYSLNLAKLAKDSACESFLQAKIEEIITT